MQIKLYRPVLVTFESQITVVFNEVFSSSLIAFSIYFIIETKDIEMIIPALLHAGKSLHLRLSRRV